MPKRDAVREQAAAGHKARAESTPLDAKSPKRKAAPDPDAGEAGSVVPRTLQILQLVAASERPPTALDIAERCGIPKPTVHRLCGRLEAEGYLAREPMGRHFRSGPKLLSLSLNALRQNAVSDERHLILEALVDQIGETCNFTMPVGHTVLYLDRVESRWPLRLHLEPGSRVPMHCTASGKLFLAALPPERLARRLDALPLSTHTPHTITTRTGLEEELSRIATRGYSIDNQEFLLGLVAIAVPVKDGAGRVVAAIACHAPSARLSVEQALGFLPQLRHAATQISGTLPT